MRCPRRGSLPGPRESPLQGAHIGPQVLRGVIDGDASLAQPFVGLDDAHAKGLRQVSDADPALAVTLDEECLLGGLVHVSKFVAEDLRVSRDGCCGAAPDVSIDSLRPWHDRHEGPRGSERPRCLDE